MFHLGVELQHCSAQKFILQRQKPNFAESTKQPFYVAVKIGVNMKKEENHSMSKSPKSELNFQKGNVYQIINIKRWIKLCHT